MLQIEIPYTEVKDKKLDFVFNGALLMAWLLVIDEDDNLIKMWEFRFEEI